MERAGPRRALAVRTSLVAASLGVPLCAATQAPSLASPGEVLGFQKVNTLEGGFGGALAPFDRFGTAVAALGDLDGDGVGDLAVGAPTADGGGVDRGAVWILFLDTDGSVLSETEIGDGVGGFGGVLDDRDELGTSLALVGDLDGDGAPELAVGAVGDDDGGIDRGAVWILSLHTDGTVLAERKVSATSGGLMGLGDFDKFGSSLAALADRDGDGVPELAVGAIGDDDGGIELGAVYVLFLAGDGSVGGSQKISETSGGFGGGLAFADGFGISVAALADGNGDGLEELAVGAYRTDDGGLDTGAVYVLTLNADGSVAAEQKISAVAGGFAGALDPFDRFGAALAGVGDMDGDGVDDLAVGAPRDADGGGSRGAVWLLFLARGGGVAAHAKISATAGGFGGELALDDRFGTALAYLADQDGDARGDLAVGAPHDDNGSFLPSDGGATWSLFLDGAVQATAATYGCGVNPPGSLRVLAGQATPGTVLTLGVDNPLGTQGAGALPLVFVTNRPDPNYPCGTLFPRFGMDPSAPGGERLVRFQLPVPAGTLFTGPPWTGPGEPTPVGVALPDDAALVGMRLFAQGVLADGAATAGPTIGLTEAVELLVGF